MKRILYVFAVVAALASCGVGKKTAGEADDTTSVSDIVQDTLVAVPVPGQLWGKTYGDYVFHDDFYYGYSYSSDTYEHYPLAKVREMYGLIVDYNHKDEIEGKIKSLGFEIIKAVVFKPNTENQYWLYVSGTGEITQIPHILYCTNLYQLDDKGIFGVDNEFVVKYDGSITTKDKIIELAKKHNVQVGKTEERSRYGYCYIYLYCSKDSSGNAVEMANWFVERGGFLNTFPSLGDAPVDFN